ncbi:MAG TPA: ABC transporter permease subunit [Acidimicrobiia bacterium]|nr:ABC transporter permease subunit [Acidimicrobiia bacterium]
MTTTTARLGIAFGADRLRRALPLVLLVAGVGLLQMASFGDSFPRTWDTLISDPIEALQDWARSNRRIHPLFTGFFTPLSNAVGGALTAVADFLKWLPWYIIPATAFLVVARTRAYGKATVALVAALYPGLVGLWEVTMETLALMAIAVAICLLVGIPLGVAAAFSARLNNALRPVLDAMQTVPAPIYFIPMVLFLGIGKVPATIATVIYAMPPIVRLTALGIKGVDEQAVEASRVFGSTSRQTLFKVQVPLAMPTIMTGINQTIMMALGIVVLATLLGAGGLGQEVMDALQQRRTGRGLAAGLAIVAVAMVLDRMGGSLADPDRTRHFSLRTISIGAGALIAAALLGRLVGWVGFPGASGVEVLDPVDRVVVWARDNLSFLTRPFNDFMVADVLIPARNILTEAIGWPVLVFVTAWLCWRLKGWKLATVAAALLLLVGLIGMWELTIETLTHVVVGVVLSVLIAVPVGVWAGRNRRIEAAIAPVLDALQTIPSFVYIIPVVMLFTIGPVPGIIASVLYAIVPGIRITALGVRQVPTETLEASEAYGATGRQTLFGVRLPLAAPTIMAGVNQVIMMVLAMIIIAGLVGGGALGFETVRAVTRTNTGLGSEVAIAVVTMAIILDRLTQAWAERLRPPAA